MKYKVGDWVLVKAKIDSTYDGAYGVTSSLFPESHIYSLAPEFTPGELIEVSEDGRYWVRAVFIAKLPEHEDCQIKAQIPDKMNRTAGWKYARKIQPKEEVSWSMNIEENFASGVGHPIVPTYVEINGTKYKLQKVEG